MQFHRDTEGAPIATDDNDQAILANFLQSDIQDDLIIGQEVLDMIKLINAGRLGNYEFSGNAHLLSINARQATITLADDEKTEAQTFPLETFRRAVNGWLAFLTVDENED